MQFASTGEVNIGDAITAGLGAGAASATITANPAMAANPAVLAALGAVTSGGASVGGDLVNGGDVSVSKATVSAVAGAVAVPGGARLGDLAETMMGAGTNSIAGEVGGAAIGEGVAAGLNTAVPALADGASAAGRAVANGARDAGRAIEQGLQELTDPDNYPEPDPLNR